MALPSSHFDLNLEKIYLDIDPDLQEQAWEQSQTLANSVSRWRAYVNKLAMRSLLSWQQSTESSSIKPMMKETLWPTVWEWVTGSACTVGMHRWVVIPTESIDDDELRVPQEWVDIPNWVGDYYLLLQVNLDDGWVKISGFSTHATLKMQGEYDPQDRTYSLPASDLLTDINIIELSEAIAPATQRAAVSSIPELPLTRANQLMQRLSDETQLNPRLAVGFGPWSALLSHSGWRTEMTRQRQGNSPLFLVNQWLQTGLSQWVQQLGWQTISVQPATAGARGENDDMAQTALSKAVTIEGEGYRLQLSKILSEQPNAWRFELRKLNGVVPAGITLRLLTEDLQPFENNEVTATAPVASLYVDVALAPEEAIVWAIAPEPDVYESEILRF